MKTKQLANVLIKILGISQIVELVSNSPVLASSIATLVNVNQTGLPSTIYYGVGALLQIIIAFLLITKSKSIAEFLFKNEEE